jgi:hypothetical protein
MKENVEILSGNADMQSASGNIYQAHTVSSNAKE